MQKEVWKGFYSTGDIWVGSWKMGRCVEATHMTIHEFKFSPLESYPFLFKAIWKSQEILLGMVKERVFASKFHSRSCQTMSTSDISNYILWSKIRPEATALLSLIAFFRLSPWWCNNSTQTPGGNAISLKYRKFSCLIFTKNIYNILV